MIDLLIHFFAFLFAGTVVVLAIWLLLFTLEHIIGVFHED